MAEKKFNNGTFFVNPAKDKAREESPDFYGSGRMPIAVLDDMIKYNNDHPGEEFIPMNCAGWRKENDHGKYISLSISVDTRERGSDGRVVKKEERQQDDREEFFV